MQDGLARHQALFGFQLIAVFNSGFFERLSPVEQTLHLVALSLTAITAIAIAFVMPPAAFHRQTTPKEVSEQFIRLASRLLLWGMLPLLIAICLDLSYSEDHYGNALRISADGCNYCVVCQFMVCLPRLDHKQSVPARPLTSNCKL